MSDEVPRAVWSGSFHVFGVDLKCHTLSNGERVIEKDSLCTLIEAIESGAPPVEDADMAAFTEWQSWAEGA
jgi:hypothetical protein